jgi:hypothetical protein
VKSPGSADFEPLRNRIAFSYDQPGDQAIDGFRNYTSLEAPSRDFAGFTFPTIRRPEPTAIALLSSTCRETTSLKLAQGSLSIFR